MNEKKQIYVVRPGANRFISRDADMPGFRSCYVLLISSFRTQKPVLCN
jgi:hypothetical protein